MNAQPLTRTNGYLAAWQCESCQNVYTTQTPAENCCRPRKCGCGANLPNGGFYCSPCREKSDRAMEAERFKRATRVTDWDGWVYCEGWGYKNGFFTSVAEFREYCLGEHEPEPEYVWTCNQLTPAKLNISDFLKHIAEAAGVDDWDPQVECHGIEELRIAIERFNAANQNVHAYEPDFTTALILNPDAA
jgi:hypothetical protein